MKALCQSAWLLTVAFGNLVVVIVAESSIFDNQVRTLKLLSIQLSLISLQAFEFIFFAAAIEVIAVIFGIMSYFYKYVDPSTLSPSFTKDLTVDEEGGGGGGMGESSETKSLVPEKEPTPFYNSDHVIESDVDTFLHSNDSDN